MPTRKRVHCELLSKTKKKLSSSAVSFSCGLDGESGLAAATVGEAPSEWCAAI